MTSIVGGNSADASDVVLMQMKELNEANAKKDELIERLTKEIAKKEERCKDLSADKRKEMEEFMKTVVDSWLSSLSGVSEQNKKTFRDGLHGCTETADARNPAWEIVCNASMDHQTNVKKIESLLQENAVKDRKIEELQGFKNQATRISMADTSSSGSAFKRQRLDTEARTGGGEPPGGFQCVTVQAPFQADGSAWDCFHNMINHDSRAQYY